MNNEVVIPWLDIGVKYAVLMFSAYYLFMRCINDKLDKKKTAIVMFFSVAISVSFIWIRAIISPMQHPLMLVYLTLTNCFLYRNEISHEEKPQGRLQLSNIVVLSLLCFSYCEALFMIIGFTFSALLSVTYYEFRPVNSNSIWDFLNDIPVHIASYVVSIFMVWMMTYLSARIRRFRRGLIDIVAHKTANTVIMVAMLLLTVVMAFGGTGIDTPYTVVRALLFVPTMAFCVVMIICTRREIMVDYISQIRERNMLLLEGSLVEKEKKIAELELDNERLAGIIRRDSELLRVMSDGLKSGSDSAQVFQAAETIEKLYTGRCDAVASLESHGRQVEGTGESTIDAILHYMACIAEDKGIEFEVDVQTDMKKLLGGEINRREFNTILADLTQNAIISAGTMKDRRVEVILLRYEDHFCLEVLDSGERFDVGVLKNMGKKPVTTHQGEGGSGIGLMTLFKILKNTGASFAIEEFSCGEKYNKAVSVTFDGAGKYRIITDRAEELKQALRSQRFEIKNREKTL